MQYLFMQYLLLILWLIYSYALFGQTHLSKQTNLPAQNHYKIKNMGYISMPKEMELNIGQVNEVLDESLSALLNKYKLEISDKKIVFLQKILNPADTINKKWRASFTIETNDSQGRDVENMGQLEVQKMNDSVRASYGAKLREQNLKILSWYGVQKVKLNGINALKLSYINQVKNSSAKNNIKTMVNTYWIYKDSKEYILTFSYKKQEQNKWKLVCSEILKSIYIE